MSEPRSLPTRPDLRRLRAEAKRRRSIAALDFYLYIGRVTGMTIRRPSPQTVKVLEALAADPSAWRYGYELGLEVDLRSGSLYPILVRLCDRNLLEARWEDGSTSGRPPRHLYRLTPSGLDHAETFTVRSDAQRPNRRRPELRGAS
jgi:PadR family transcriptional regulator, regulatory protein PadR